MKISAIAVISKNRALGKDNALIFHVPGDLPRFKKITQGHPVIMGRKTFESKEINKRPLPNRLNIVVTRDLGYTAEGVVVRHSVEEALDVANKDLLFPHDGTSFSEASSHDGSSTTGGLPTSRGRIPLTSPKLNTPGNYNDEEIFILGGGQIYQAAWPYIEKLYLTVVETEAVGDTFFPDYSEFSKVVFKEEHDSGGYRYTFLELEKEK